MTTTLMTGLLGAMLVFWAVGAYNRLIRLRAQAAKAYSALDQVVSAQSVWIKAAQPLATEPVTQAPGQPASPAPDLWPRLEAAAEQLEQALPKARARPLEPDAIRALSTAYIVMTEVWKSPQAQCLDGAVHPQGFRARLSALDEQALGHAHTFDAAVTVYNRAIRQFPALILAAIWHFRPALALGWSPAPSTVPNDAVADR